MVFPLSTPSLISSSRSSSTPDKHQHEHAHASATSIPIITCSSAKEVMGAITIFCRVNDTVLELGTELSDFSSHLCQTIGPGGTAVLVGNNKKKKTDEETAAATTNGGHGTIGTFGFTNRVQYIELHHQFSDWKVQLFSTKQQQQQQQQYSYDILILSVSHILGNDLYMTTLSLANEIVGHMKIRNHPPRAIIIKSKSLYSLSRRLVHSQNLDDKRTTRQPSQQQQQLVRSSEPLLIATIQVDDYRQTIPHVIQCTDRILEVGCHFGRTTTLLNDAGDYCIGVDIGPKIIEHAKKQYPNITFAVGDAWKTLELLKLQQNSCLAQNNNNNNNMGYDVVYADIGGLSGADGYLEALALLDSLGNALEPRCIVIKSLCMRQLASRLLFFPHVWEKYNREGTESNEN
jgi:SAM-dependent methyltransferase